MNMYNVFKTNVFADLKRKKDPNTKTFKRTLIYKRVWILF